MLTVWEDVSNSLSWISVLFGQSLKHFSEENIQKKISILYKIVFKIQSVTWPVTVTLAVTCHSDPNPDLAM